MVVVALAWVMGVIAVTIGVSAAARRSDQSRGSEGWVGPIAWMITGFVLMAFPVFVNVVTRSVFDGEWSLASATLFSSAPHLLSVFDGHATQETILGILIIIQFLGFIAMFRGVWMLNGSAQIGQQPTVGAGLVHLVGGVLALNIDVVLEILDQLVSA